MTSKIMYIDLFKVINIKYIFKLLKIYYINFNKIDFYIPTTDSIKLFTL